MLWHSLRTSLTPCRYGSDQVYFMFIIFSYLCTARHHSLRMQSSVLAIIDSVCLSVRLSVWHSPVSGQNDSSYDHVVFAEDSPWLVFSWLTSPQNCKGNIGSGGPNEGGVEKIHDFQPISRLFQKRCKIRPELQITNFDWYQNYRPWMTLNGRYALYRRKDAYFGAHWTKIDP